MSSSEHSIDSCGDGEHNEGEEPEDEQAESHDRFNNSISGMFGKNAASANTSTSSGLEENIGGNGNIGSGEDDTETYISEMPAAVLKLTYKFTNTETKLLRRILSSHGLKEANESQNFNLLWTGLHMKPDILRNLTPYQRINHFPRYDWHG